MCIAIAKMRGVDVPDEHTLKNCWDNNDDGAGFAFNLNGRVLIKKGYMRWDDFIKAFRSYNEKYNFKERGLLIHFRIATHGARDATMTHPFPVVSDEGALKKIDYTSSFAAVHNGIITLTSYVANKSKVLSDTAIFIRDYLTPLSTNENWLHNPSNMELVHNLIESKMAILDGSGWISKTDGFIEDNGVYYSNTTYKDFTTRHKIKTTVIPYGFDYYDYDDNNDYDDYGTYNYDEFKYTSTKIKACSENVDLMKVKPGDFIDCPMYYSDVCKPGDNYYVDKNFALYSLDTESDANYQNGEKYVYIGKCNIYTAGLTPVHFKKNLTVKSYQLED